MRVTLNLALVILVSATGAEGVVAQDRVPLFKNYPVSNTYRAKNAPLTLTRADRMFRTRLMSAARNEKPNFAGHYILTIWGCGTSCVMGAVIDANTGKVYWWNFTVCCWPNEVVDNEFKPIEFRLNSSLIIFSGARNEKDDDIGAHYYKFEKGRFIHLKSILSPKQSL